MNIFAKDIRDIDTITVFVVAIAMFKVGILIGYLL